MLLRLPWAGETVRKFATSQLARTLATLLGGGIPLVNALEIAGKLPYPLKGREGYYQCKACRNAYQLGLWRSRVGELRERAGGAVASVNSNAGVSERLADRGR